MKLCIFRKHARLHLKLSPPPSCEVQGPTLCCPSKTSGAEKGDLTPGTTLGSHMGTLVPRSALYNSGNVELLPVHNCTSDARPEGQCEACSGLVPWWAERAGSKPSLPPAGLPSLTEAAGTALLGGSDTLRHFREGQSWKEGVNCMREKGDSISKLSTV